MRELLTDTGEALRAKLAAARDAGRDVMVRRAFRTEIKASDGGTRQLDFVISTEAVDRYGDIIKADGWQLDQYKTNPVVLGSTNADVPPIAKASKVRAKDGKLLATAEFDTDPFSKSIFQKLKGGFLSATSWASCRSNGPSSTTRTGAMAWTSNSPYSRISVWFRFPPTRTR